MSELVLDLQAALGIPKKAGTENLYTYSPCCNRYDDKFMVNFEKERWVCNHQDSCGERGNLFSLAKLLNVKINQPNRSYYKPMYTKPVPKKYKVLPVENTVVNIEQPEQIEINMSDRLKQLEALFGPEDKLIVCKNANYGETIETNLISLENEFDNFTHIKVNHGGAKACDISDFKYTLVECDDLNDLGLQKKYLVGLELPIQTLTWSGNKSLHAIVRIDAATREEYDSRVSLLHTICQSVGFNIDKTKDPCRYTRLAGSINPKTNKVQTLIAICIGAKSFDQWLNESVPKLEVTAHTINTGSFESAAVMPGFSSGFLTHDYNDSGLKAGGLTLLTGRRNQGKTTFARQIMIAAAKQELGVYAYMGEGEIEREKGYLERLVAKDGELTVTDNSFGRTDWFANSKAKKRYNDTIARFIDFYQKPLLLKGYVFDSILSEMTIKARQGTVLFVIDNMMKLTADQEDVFKAQKVIISKLKEFAVHFKIHIILICHPRKDGHSVSGSMEQENTADTILKFQRVLPGTLESELSQMESEKITAIVTNEKVRDGGQDKTMYMEFDPTRQANIEIVYIASLYRMAAEYKKDDFYSREMIYV